jgi:uncharacterized membrane protein
MPGRRAWGLLIRIGLDIIGSEVVGYTIGVMVVLVAIFLLGLLVQTRLRGTVAVTMDAIMQRILVVRSVCDRAKKFVHLFGRCAGRACAR